MAIDPISLPNAAGVDFGEGDVRHFSEGDGVSVPALSNPTRQLANRDSILAKKVNEIIEDVNNKEQLVSVPIARTIVPASAEEIIANFRIPPGYEARVLNAAINSSPVSSDIELNVMWANGFGNVSGESLVSTSSELTGGTKFSPTGEFIISAKNKGDTELDIAASITLTMRPITSVTSALLPAPSISPAGPPGTKGDKGGKGDSGGAGPAGSPGLIFRQQWTPTPFPINYSVNDVVTHDFAGTSRRSSYVCLLPHIADGVNQPQPSLTPSLYWDFMAEAGATGGTGGTGQTGASGIPAFTIKSITTDGTTSSDYLPTLDTGDDNYSRTNLRSAGSHYEEVWRWNEYVIQGGTEAINGLAYLQMSDRRQFKGTIAYDIPGVADGAQGNWDVTNVTCVASIHGTVNTVDSIVSGGTFATLVEVIPDNDRYLVKIASQSPQKVGVAFSGVTTVFVS